MELRGYSDVFAVNSKGYLGPICDDSWCDKHATIVCRQLGFNTGIATIRSQFGSVPADFAMDDLQCVGTEETIQQCRYTSNDDCGCNEGAGVECS